MTTGLIPVTDAIVSGEQGVLVAPNDATAMRYNIALADGATVEFILRRNLG